MKIGKEKGKWYSWETTTIDRSEIEQSDFTAGILSDRIGKELSRSLKARGDNPQREESERIIIKRKGEMVIKSDKRSEAISPEAK